MYSTTCETDLDMTAMTAEYKKFIKGCQTHNEGKHTVNVYYICICNIYTNVVDLKRYSFIEIIMAASQNFTFSFNLIC